MNKKPTMNDVAKLAQVGRGTVSNYINGEKIREENRIKIEKAIKELGYVPNLQARSLKTSKNSTVVFIVPTSWTPFFSEMVFKMQKELSNKGYKMILANSHSSPKEEREILKMAMLNQVSGVITMSYSDIYNVMDFGKNSNLVSIERYVSPDVPLVTSDNEAGGRLAAKEMIKLKKKKILLLRRKVNHHNATDVRTEAFINYLKDRNIEVEIFEASLKKDYRQEFYKYLEEKFRAKEVNFDGIFAVTDEYGQVAKDALSRIDSNLLKKVEIIGFDGARASRESPLVIDSIRQPVDKIVQESVKVLLEMIEGNKIVKNYRKVLPVTFAKSKTEFL